MKKILIVGNGFLGRNLFKEFKKNQTQVFTTSHKNLKHNDIFLDICSLESVKNIIKQLDPDVIINCAAITDIDYLQTHSDEAFSINALGPKNLAIICNKKNIRLIQISTDSIFDGNNNKYSEEDIPHPVNFYGESKLLGEKFVSEYSQNYVIIRTNFFGFNNEQKFLFNSIFNILSKNEEFIGFDDVIFNPLEISNLCEMIKELTNSKFIGTINLSSNDSISKYQFALEIAKVFDFNPNLIKRGSIEEVEFIAKRPKNTTLSNKKAIKILKTKIIPITSSLEKIKKEIE